MARKDFGSMLETIDAQADDAKPVPAAKKPKTSPAKKAAAKPVEKATVVTAPATTNKPVEAGDIKTEALEKVVAGEPKAGGVGYDKLHVKAARIHDHQNDALVEIARDLNRARKGQGHRITENTLVRLALDLLIKHRDDLKGTTEAELASSLKL